MSLDELKERIKDEVVLREGDLFEWQWRQLGLVSKAETAGVPPGDFLNVVNDVSRAINPYFGRISDLKINVADLARSQRKKLTGSQITQIVADAARLQLRADFVKDRWIPAILATMPDPVELTDVPVSIVPIAEPTTIPVAVLPATPMLVTPPVESVNPPVPPSRPAPFAGPDRDAVSLKVHQFLNEYVAENHIPVRVLKPLFLATNFDKTILADAVLTYLSANFYAAETPVRGETLKDKLLSTDWRHLSWWQSVSTPPALPVDHPTLTNPPRRTGSSDTTVIGLSVLVVSLLIGGIWWTMRDKTFTFTELFADNQRNWPSGKIGPFEYEVAHSAYFVRRIGSRDGQLGHAYIELPGEIDLNGASSFRVEVEMVVPKTVRIRSGLMLGVGNGQHYTAFLIRGTDSVLFKNVDGETAETALLSDSRRVNKSIRIDAQSNTLRVEKRNGQLFFAINGQNLLGSPVAFRPFAGNGIGFVSAAETVKFVNLRVVVNP